MYFKVKAFAVEAGKVILVISMILWAMASYGPGNQMQEAAAQATEQAREAQLSESEAGDLVASSQLEASYIGHLGKFIEPAIQPLGFDWKIGISLITSFAAREVFVGTMATIYSIGSQTDDGEELMLREKMAQEVNPVTKEKIFNPATSWSLLIFYVFALQCMSTLAVVKRETNSWKWPIIQFLFMSGVAYVASWLTYIMLA